jgi:hypothetical protein
MGQAFGGSLPPAVGFALSPIPIIAVVLGWLIGLGVVGTIVLAASRPGSRVQAGDCAAAQFRSETHSWHRRTRFGGRHAAGS